MSQIKNGLFSALVVLSLGLLWPEKAQASQGGVPAAHTPQTIAAKKPGHNRVPFLSTSGPDSEQHRPPGTGTTAPTPGGPVIPSRPPGVGSRSLSKPGGTAKK